MANARQAVASRHLRMLFEVGTVVGLTDGQLLDRFVTGRDEAAFTALIERHGPMVQRVCGEVLGDYHDAQDAFQATFLVLARRAASIRRRDSLASWLYGVALRVSACARSASARRRIHERKLGRTASGADQQREEEPRRLRAALARGARPASRAVSRAGRSLLPGRPDLRRGGPALAAARWERSRAGWPRPASGSGIGWRDSSSPHWRDRSERSTGSSRPRSRVPARLVDTTVHG